MRQNRPQDKKGPLDMSRTIDFSSVPAKAHLRVPSTVRSQNSGRINYISKETSRSPIRTSVERRRQVTKNEQPSLINSNIMNTDRSPSPRPAYGKSLKPSNSLNLKKQFLNISTNDLQRSESPAQYTDRSPQQRQLQQKITKFSSIVNPGRFLSLHSKGDNNHSNDVNISRLVTRVPEGFKQIKQSDIQKSMNVKDVGIHFAKKGIEENTGNPTPRHVSKKSTDFRLNLLNLGKTTDKAYLDPYRNTDRPSSRLKLNTQSGSTKNIDKPLDLPFSRVKQVFHCNKDKSQPSKTAKFTKQFSTENLRKKAIDQQLLTLYQAKSISPMATSKISVDPPKLLRGIHGYYLHKVQEAYMKPYSEDYFAIQYREHFCQTYQGVHFTQYLRPHDTSHLKQKKVHLERKDNHKSIKFNRELDRVSLIFDLDETLVHCNENSQKQSDVTLKIQLNKGDIINAGVNIRPGAQKLLEELSKYFEIIIFTASHSCYAEKVIQYLDPLNQYVTHKLYRESCVMTQAGMYTKDLRILANRSLDQLVLIDNASYSYAWQVDNGVPILPFYENKKDTELRDLQDYLMGLRTCSDIRDYNRQNLKMHLLNDPFGPQSAFKKIFGYNL